MQKACGCPRRAFTVLACAVVFGTLLCGRDVAKAQDVPTPQQSQTANEAATPTAQTGSAPAIPPENTRGAVCDLPKNSGDGLVIISATLPPKTRHAGFPVWFRYKYKLKDAGWRHEGEILVNSNRGFRNAPSDFDGVFGKLYILRLPAGSYQFKDWEYQPLGFRGTEVPNGIYPPLPFKVESGRAIYLGGFDPTLIEGRNLLHLKVDEAWPLVHDDQTRDLPVFFNRCPGFDRSLLDVKVMDGSPWRPPERK